MRDRPQQPCSPACKTNLNLADDLLRPTSILGPLFFAKSILFYYWMKMFRLTICLALLSGVLVAKPLSEKPTEKQIPRFSMLADGLYRGGQPDQKGFEFLKKQGFKTIINLRAESDEANIVKQLGMNYAQIPIGE